MNSESLASRLILSDGSVFEGFSFGAAKTVFGELVFNTSMTGYQEALTDPSYAGQVLCFAYPLIGNYGFSDSASESSKVHLSGVVVREACVAPVHRSSTASIHDFLEEQGVPGISGVDTRLLVTRIREYGVIPCCITTERVEKVFPKLKEFDYSKVDYTKLVLRGGKQFFQAENEKHKVVLVDYGAKQNIVRELLKKNCSVTVVPCNYSAKQILQEDFDGLMLSNGPGDPALLSAEVSVVRDLIKQERPIFGICLGHQLLGCALGASTYKLKFGHRGGNHAVINKETNRMLVTSQNHGFALRNLPDSCVETFVNANDASNEGLRCKTLPIFSIQFHPEASPGPLDAKGMFDDFVRLMK